MAPQVRTAQFWELVWLSRASGSTDSEVGVYTTNMATPAANNHGPVSFEMGIKRR
jgi:hypothetical protein